MKTGISIWLALVSLALALAAGLALVSSAAARSGATRLNIYAAASLTEVFPNYDANENYNFAGSNALETQIRNGAPADVFASASPTNTQTLFKAGLVDKPLTFTANRVVLIVPKSNPAGITNVYDLAKVNAKVVLAAPSVPVGSYARTVLRNLGISAAVLGKVVSNESDVKGVVGKIALGQGDAGFVYATDVKPVADQVTAIKIPAWAQPRVRYEIAVVSKSPNKTAARAWIKGILSKKGQATLAASGFLPIPKRP
jgi:molybdate transport system substrate-binding protein